MIAISFLVVLLSGYLIYRLWEDVYDSKHLSGFQRDAIHQKLVGDIQQAEHDIDEQRDVIARWMERRVLRHASIFVSVAAFRDALCQTTVKDLFDQAANPRRVFVGAVEQNEHGDPICVHDSLFDCRRTSGAPGNDEDDGFCAIDNIRRRRIVTSNGKGPTFGRYVSMLMYRDESYVMSIDSHNRFRPHWDRLMVEMLLIADSGKPVLSHYPLAWNDNTDVSKPPPYVTVMCRAHFVPMGYVRMGGINFPNSRRPRRQPWTAAGFLAADAAMIHEVPFDPHLDYLFDGEELLYSARLWTHGWDSFAPSSNLVYHRYNRMSGGLPAWRFWSVPGLSWAGRQAVSVRRVQWMLQIPKRLSAELIVPSDCNETGVIVESSRYGLGTARPLEQLWHYAQLDLRTKSDQPGICSKYFSIRKVL